MLVKDVINRLKDTRGFLNEKQDTEEFDFVGEDKDEIASIKYMLEGIEEAIKLIQDSK